MFCSDHDMEEFTRDGKCQRESQTVSSLRISTTGAQDFVLPAHVACLLDLCHTSPRKGFLKTLCDL